ncbi:unnamed protein product [Cylicocyclus nassatus]|uniref:SXP/RAL-2 family protein Ani s 5-like cation-binding domain-containing protein n=1 Tax=Cylicocyclus nassatus TaxID=53992 RepID=A0AA36H1F9_CYLNA|nr:unnamed protein product [Cylicocyclus nassatus]
MDKTLLFLAIIVAVVLAHSEESGHSEEDDSDDDEPNEPLFNGERSHHHARIPPPPPYLRNVTKKAREEYITILRNMSMTISEQDRKTHAWAEKYGVADEFAQFNSNMARLKEEIKRNITLLISELPQAVDKAFEILENKNQTFLQLLHTFGNLTKENPLLYRAVNFIYDIFYLRAFAAHGIPRTSEVVLEKSSSATEDVEDQVLMDKIYKLLKDKGNDVEIKRAVS